MTLFWLQEIIFRSGMLLKNLMEIRFWRVEGPMWSLQETKCIQPSCLIDAFIPPALSPQHPDLKETSITDIEEHKCMSSNLILCCVLWRTQKKEKQISPSPSLRGSAPIGRRRSSYVFKEWLCWFKSGLCLFCFLPIDSREYTCSSLDLADSQLCFLTCRGRGGDQAEGSEWLHSYTMACYRTG